MSLFYTIYLSKTDEVIASGTAMECVKQMNMKSLNAFHSMVSKSTKGLRKKYTVVKEDILFEEDSDSIIKVSK